MVINACGATFKGNVRNHNEDNIYVDGQYKEDTSANVFLAESNRTTGPFLYAVFDGLGGELYGEEASLIATKLLHKAESNADYNSPDLDKFIGTTDKAIRMRAVDHGARTMGTTAAIVLIQDEKAIACNVGDSRIYMFRDDKLTQISKDHSIVQSMIELGFLSENERYSNSHSGELTQYLGMSSEEGVEPSSDITEIKLIKDDIVLLCSDGLNNELNDDAVEKMLRRSKDMEPRYITTDLIMTAKEGACVDNVSVIIIKCM